MNYTEEEIIAKGKVVLEDIQGEYYNESNIEKAIYDPEEKLIRGSLGTIPAWIVIINEPVFDSLIFLTISDETSEPLYIQSKHMVSEIIKNVDGKYIKK